MKNYRLKGGYNPSLIMPNSYHYRPSRHRRWRKRLLQFILVLIALGCVAGMILFKVFVKKDLPDISQIKDITFSQATVITDRNGQELYKLFSENRQYVDYSAISPNMINAIVAVEDQRYWEHAGLDARGMIRAIISKLLHPKRRMQGASTIPQQLVRNLLLTSDRTVVRKLKEITLTKQLDKVLGETVRDTRGRLEGSDMTRAKKELTLELYLNKIEFGNNAFGIEAASQTYFGIPAVNLTVLQSSILASIPKGPGAYNPYTHRAATVGSLKITDKNGNEYSFSATGIQAQVQKKLKDIIDMADFSNKKDYASFSKYLNGLISDLPITVDGVVYNITYSVGRKDLVLCRMFEDGYISEDDLKQALLDGFTIELRSAGFSIKAPHFVMWVIELLEKQYDKDKLKNGGLTVKTSLDYPIQKIAESSLSNNKSALEVYGATNEAMVYLDSTNGDILAYVGSFDYFNEDIAGQNDMVQSARQVGSAIKPLIYSLGFMNLPLTLDTPIYDIPFKIGPDRPNNADGKRLGLLSVKSALAYSRNIPAAKMIQAVGGQDVALPFLRKLGMISLSSTGDYGYTLALGAGEIPMLELAQAYMHLSTPTPGIINPILEVRTSDGTLLYQKEDKKQEQIIPTGVSYLLREILSNPANMPPNWAGAYSVRGLKFGLKSGTSNMKTPRGDRARDGWLATYTPSRVAVFRGGNADGSPMYQNAYGGFLNAEAMRDFWSTLLANNHISNVGMTAVEVGQTTISKISGKLATSSTPAEFSVNSMGYIKTMPTMSDDGAVPVEFDASCNGLSSPYTPSNDLKKGYMITPSSFMPDSMDLLEITDWWNRSTNKTLLDESGFAGKVSFNYDNILTQMPQDYCEGRSPKMSDDIHIDIKNIKEGQQISSKPMFWFNVQSVNNIKRVTVSINNKVVGSTEYDGKSNDITDVISSNLGDISGMGDLTLLAVDDKGYSNKTTVKVSVVSGDIQAPYILKEKTYVVQDENRGYRVVIFLNDALSSVEGGTISQDGKVIKTFTKNYADFFLKTPGELSISAKDSYGNKMDDKLDIRKYVPGYRGLEQSGDVIFATGGLDMSQ